MPPADSLDLRCRVHVYNRHHLAFAQKIPQRGIDIGFRSHVRHGASRFGLRVNDNLVLLGKDLRGLGHETDSTENY